MKTREILVWFLVACLLSIGFTAHWSNQGWMTIPGDLGDSRLVNYFLEHGFLWVRQIAPHQNFWDVPFFYPEKNVMAYSESLLGTLPWYALPRLLGILPEEAFRTWFQIISALNFLVFAAFCRIQLKASRAGTFLGSFLFAFAASRANQLNHPQLLTHFYTVLSVWGLVRLFEHPRHPLGWILFFSGLVAQIYASFYMGWFYVLGLFLLGVLCVSSGRYRVSFFQHLKGNGITWTLGSILSTVAMTPWLQHHLLAARTQGPRSFSEVHLMLPKIKSWFHLGSESLLYRDWLNFDGLQMAHEHRIGIGIFTFLFLIFAVRVLVKKLRAQELPPHWRPVIVASLFVMSALFILATVRLPFGIPLWKSLYLAFPGGNAIRAVARASLFLLLPISLLAVAGYEFILSTRGKWVTGLLCALVILEQPILPAKDRAYRFDEVRTERQALLSRANFTDCEAFYFIARGDGPAPEWKLQTDALWLSLEAAVPTLNGYSGSPPKRWGELGLWNLKPATPSLLATLKNSVQIWWQEKSAPGNLCFFNE